MIKKCKKAVIQRIGLSLDARIRAEIVSTKYDYNERASVLSCLHMKSYSRYLSSSLWKQIREQTLELWQYSCSACGMRRATCVHHRSYCWIALSGHEGCQRFLRPLCSRCHYRVEFDPNGNKRWEGGMDAGRKAKVALLSD